ncbi:protein shortage in chiasmata 1 ortholog [Sceloporus undulatus]|uniref:protein shortage in chiasmata 1 ortholog n=1 Tax=Sceloporus undulatus TaxID=8520 RepID=UPI001C4C1D00|nr:protein shortage in chiasmata 1 ortholog [Sceloporus undulatus]
MFAAVKYIGIDYYYEKVARERLSFECLAIHIPSCLYQDKNYYHDGRFADDKYRKPWTRVSIDSTQMTFSMLDLWKKSLYIDDFLERKPISSTCFYIHNEEVEIVPSSNPCSPFDIEEAYMLKKESEKKEPISDNDLQSSSAPEVVKEQEKGLYIEDELIFTDYLVQYANWLPTLQTLLSRLNIFYVEDPLLNSEGDRITEEDIFRECLTFKRTVTLLFAEESHEDFCKVSLKDEKAPVLAIQLPFYKTADLRLCSEIPTYLALKNLYQVTPEVTGDENECLRITSEDFEGKITPETMEMSNCCSILDIYANKNRSLLDFREPEASYTSFHPAELELPLTPPSRTEKFHVNLLCTQLQQEPVSPFGNSDLIPESTTECLENRMWQSEKYQHPLNSLLLTDQQNVVPLCQQLPVTELKTLLSVHEDTLVFSSLEEDGWINLREKMASPCILEAFCTDLSDGVIACTEGEVFSKFTEFQLDKCLEENISLAKTTVESFRVAESSRTKDSCWSPPKKETFSSFRLEPTSIQYDRATEDESTPTENHIEETKLGREIRKPLSFGSQKEDKNDEFQLISLNNVSVGPDSVPQNKRPVPLELPRKSQDDFDFLSNFIMLRSKHVITQSEETNNVDIQEEGPNAKEESPAPEKHDSPIILNTTVPIEKQSKENEAAASIEIKPSESQFQAYLILEVAVAPFLQDLMTLGMCNWKFATLNFDDSRFFLKQQEKVMKDTFKEGVTGLKTGYLLTEKRGTLLESKNVISSLQRYSCVVVRNQHIGPDFPWTHFSLMVEYNYSENSCWVDLCKKLNISYITFKTALPEAAGIDEGFPDNLGGVLSNVPIPYVFLTSEGLINTPEILQLLESKYNITFIERSCCEALQFFGSTERYVVMTIDECTALVMQNVEELSYEKSSDNIVLRLMVLSLQYSSCWILLYSRERLNFQYSLGGKTLHHLALIYAALVPFAQKSEDFDVKVALTPGIEETAFLVRQIADHTLLTSKKYPQEWLDKAWLSVLPSEAEKCLLTFPCIHPLVAQVMLKKSSSLEWLLSATFAQLQQLLPEVPEKVLKHFTDITSLYNLKPLPKSKPIKQPMPPEGETNSTINSSCQLLNSEVLLSSFPECNPFNEYSGFSPEVQKSKSCSLDYYQNEFCTPLKSTLRNNLTAPAISYKEERHQCLPFLKKMETERRVHSSLALNNLEEPKHICCEASMPYLSYSQSGTNTYLENYTQNRMFLSKVSGGQKLEIPVLSKNPVHQDVKNVCEIKKQPPVKQRHSAQDFRYSWCLDFNKGRPFQQSSDHFLGEFEGIAYCSPELQSEKKLGDKHPFLQAAGSSFHSANFYKTISNTDGFFNPNFQITGDYAAKKGPNLSYNLREQDASAGLEFAQLPQLKKRRLTFEKDPARSDGQTRLKFF